AYLLWTAGEMVMGDGSYFGGILDELKRSPDTAYEPLRADHLGDDQTTSTVPLDQPTERRVRHARHGSDGEGRRQLEVTYSHFNQCIAAGPGTAVFSRADGSHNGSARPVLALQPRTFALRGRYWSYSAVVSFLRAQAFAETLKPSPGGRIRAN